ncbi:hypothetical protein GCM10009764_78550 [Nocardia ninae]|uniref:Uncharacterized protein n=1 Tax=Nocardia ninae NBRC 108245 TaxID=1210091 RepID=A0A511MCQ6_9NOCA|nr:hypothetical protein NN4_29730 [Nocardia ninae NBRC 108245]
MLVSDSAVIVYRRHTVRAGHVSYSDNLGAANWTVDQFRWGELCGTSVGGLYLRVEALAGIARECRFRPAADMFAQINAGN